jgi:hypothetical protein
MSSFIEYFWPATTTSIDKTENTTQPADNNEAVMGVPIITQTEEPNMMSSTMMVSPSTSPTTIEDDKSSSSLEIPMLIREPCGSCSSNTSSSSVSDDIAELKRKNLQLEKTVQHLQLMLKQAKAKYETKMLKHAHFRAELERDLNTKINENHQKEREIRNVKKLQRVKKEKPHNKKQREDDD